MTTRIFALICALISWVGLVVQLYLLMTGPLGPLGGVWRFFAFFTILTNLLAACLYTLAAIKPDFVNAHARLYTASAVYLTTVGITYVTLLQSRWTLEGLPLFADRTMHHVAPAAAVLFWLICVPKAGLKWGDSARWTGVPLLYLFYSLVRAPFDGFYPYFFIDAGALGWGRVAINVAAMTVGFVILGLIFVAAAKALSRKMGPATAT